MDFISFVTVAVSLRSRNLFSAFPSRLGRATPCSVLPDPGHDAVFVRADGIAVVAYNVEDRKCVFLTLRSVVAVCTVRPAASYFCTFSCHVRCKCENGVAFQQFKFEGQFPAPFFPGHFRLSRAYWVSNASE